MKKLSILIYNSILFTGLYVQADIVQAEEIIYNPLNPAEEITPQGQPDSEATLETEPSQITDSSETSEKTVDSVSQPELPAIDIPKMLDNQVPLNQGSTNTLHPSVKMEKMIQDVNVLNGVRGTQTHKIVLTDAFFNDRNPNSKVAVSGNTGSGKAGINNDQAQLKSYLLSGTLLYGQKPENRGQKYVQNIFR